MLVPRSSWVLCKYEWIGLPIPWRGVLTHPERFGGTRKSTQKCRETGGCVQQICPRLLGSVWMPRIDRTNINGNLTNCKYNEIELDKLRSQVLDLESWISKTMSNQKNASDPGAHPSADPHLRRCRSAPRMSFPGDPKWHFFLSQWRVAYFPKKCHLVFGTCSLRAC